MQSILRAGALAASVLLAAASGSPGAIPDGVLERTKKFEGVVPHLYLDTEGNVTVGVGHLVPDVESSQKLGLVHKTDGKPATAAEIKADWKAVSEAEKGKKADYYDKLTQLKLPDAVVEELLKKDVENVIGALQKKFPEYDKYPVKAQAGLIDMGFNLGVDKLVKKFEKFTMYVKEKKWKEAAKESHRKKPVPEERNDAIKKLFEEAESS